MSKKEKFKVALLIGSIRKERQGIHVAEWVEHQLTDNNFEVTVVDPKEKPLPLVGDRYKDFAPGTAPALLEELHQVFSASDGFVLVTPEYNHSTSGVLKNLLDTFNRKEFAFKPALIVSYSNGGFGGVRAIEHLRQITVDLGLTPIHAAISISHVDEAFTHDGQLIDSIRERYQKQAAGALAEFVWYLEALKRQREKSLPE